MLAHDESADSGGDSGSLGQSRDDIGTGRCLAGSMARKCDQQHRSIKKPLCTVVSPASAKRPMTGTRPGRKTAANVITEISARSRKPIRVDVSMLSRSSRACSPVSTVVLPVLLLTLFTTPATYLHLDGFEGLLCRLRSRSAEIRVMAQCPQIFFVVLRGLQAVAIERIINDRCERGGRYRPSVPAL
jgi:hypothetical protein